MIRLREATADIKGQVVGTPLGRKNNLGGGHLRAAANSLGVPTILGSQESLVPVGIVITVRPSEVRALRRGDKPL